MTLKFAFPLLYIAAFGHIAVASLKANDENALVKKYLEKYNATGIYSYSTSVHCGYMPTMHYIS